MNRFLIIALSFGATAAIGCSSAKKESDSSRAATKAMEKQRKNHQAELDSLVEGWPAASRAVAEVIFEKHGLPTESTANMLIWYETSPWKKTVVHRDQVVHLFPIEHRGVLEQVTDYRVPPDKMDDIAKFNGSVIVDRTKGEVAVRSDSEDLNFLIMNLTSDIVRDIKTTEQARQELGASVLDLLTGDVNPNMESFTFTTAINTSDPGESVFPTTLDRAPASVPEEGDSKGDSSVDNSVDDSVDERGEDTEAY